MKKILVILILLLTIPSVLADWFYNSQNVIVNIDIKSEAEIIPTTPSGYIDTATINLTFFPKQTESQELLKFYTNPEAELTNKTLKFAWKIPEGRIDFKLNADVKTTNTIIQIKQKINFPIEELPADVLIYTKPSETIDSNDEDIIRLASELVKGEDDLYSAVYKIADWTKNNVNYNLSTLTAEVSQKASWVLENKQGVCDELTSLFIALLRAVGIPARFVSGIAYTNSELFPERWGPHGWAEVYFPSYGWVPFDVTYAEYGWVDPTHIKFKDSVDSDEPSTYYNWLGRDADLKTKKLDIKTNLIEKVGYARTPLKIELSVLKKSINFGSYNLVEASLENTGDFYYSTELYLSKPKEVKIIANEVSSLDFMPNKASTDFAVVRNEFKSILLLPKEKKKIFWILRLDTNLDRKYSYTFPIVASTLNNITSETSFTSSVREQDVSFEEVKQIAKLYQEEKEKKYSGNVVLDCKITKSELYEYEDAEVDCTAKNSGNVFLDALNACFDNKCNKTSMGISQSKDFTFKINTSKIGLQEIPVVLSNELVSKAAYVKFKINDAPKIEIEDLVSPVNVSYDKNFTVSFTIAKKSQSNPKNAKVVFAQNGFEKKWHINELAENRKFVIGIEGKQLSYGKNDYKISVDYSDGLKKHYNANKEFSIYLVDATLFQRMLLALNKFEGLSPKTIVISLVTGTIIFVGVIWVLFRRARRRS